MTCTGGAQLVRVLLWQGGVEGNAQKWKVAGVTVPCVCSLQDDQSEQGLRPQARGLREAPQGPSPAHADDSPDGGEAFGSQTGPVGKEREQRSCAVSEHSQPACTQM